MPKRKDPTAVLEPTEKKTKNKNAYNNRSNCLVSSDNDGLNEFVNLSMKNSLKQDSKLTLEEMKIFEGKSFCLN